MTRTTFHQLSVLASLLFLAAGSLPGQEKQPQRKFKPNEVYNYSEPIMFQTDFKSGAFDKLKVSQDARYSLEEWSRRRIAIVDAPDSRSGNRAARFGLSQHKGEFRSEIAFPHESGHQDRWYAISTYIPLDWTHGPDDQGDIIMQWHAIPGNDRPTFPNLSIDIKRGRWSAKFSSGSPQEGPERRAVELNKVKLGSWINWVIHAQWSPSRNGRILIWQDGKLVADESGPNVYSTIGVDYTPYFKTGLYHPSWKQKPSQSKPSVSDQEHVIKQLYVTDIAVGGERASLKSMTSVFHRSRHESVSRNQ